MEVPLRPQSVIAFAVALAALAPAALHAEEPAAYVVRLGGDTLSLEQFTRTPTRVQGEYLVRTPRSLYRTYVMDLNADGTVRRFQLTTRTLGTEPLPPVTRTTIDFTGDSAIMVIPQGDSSATRRIPARRGAVPSLNGVMGIMDQIARQYRAAGRDSYAVDLVPPGAPRVLEGTVTRAGRDRLNLDVVTSVGRIPPFALTLDPQGGLKAFSGRGSVFQAEGERIKDVNLPAATRLFEYRPLGALSTRDTARAMLGDGALWVDYGRPLKRDRVIFGDVVPWGTVWRTGANAATQLSTAVDLVIGDATVPAGTYSLWTLPSASGWKLIVNRQAGQWGTQYDPARDLARVDMKVETLPVPVEMMTIEIAPAGAGATLVISWDLTRVSVPLRRKA